MNIKINQCVLFNHLLIKININKYTLNNRKGNTKRTRNNKNMLKGARSLEVEKNNAIDINDKKSYY